MNYTPLTRAGEKLVSLIKSACHQKEFIYSEDVIPYLDAMQKIFPQWIFQVCPVNNPEVRYISQNCEQVLGYKHTELIDLFPAGITSFAEENDQQDVKECFRFLYDFLSGKPADDFPQIRIVLRYRIKHKNGNTLFIQDEKACIQLQNGKLVFYNIIRDITEETAFKGVCLDIFNQHKTVEKIASFNPGKKQQKLSRREAQLVSLISKGFRTKEIASHLNISHHTVRNIRQRMFEKYSVNSSIELLNKAV